MAVVCARRRDGGFTPWKRLPLLPFTGESCGWSSSIMDGLRVDRQLDNLGSEGAVESIMALLEAGRREEDD